MSMIKIENLTFSYPTSYDNVFENVSFQVDTDWKLGFVGRNGRGKTTFLNLLLGKYEYSGKILSSVQFDYFPYSIAEKKDLTVYLQHIMRFEGEFKIQIMNTGKIVCNPAEYVEGLLEAEEMEDERKLLV